MKKNLFVIFVLTFMSTILHAARGTTLDYPVKLWRSSATGDGELFNNAFTSGSFVLHAVCVSSPITNNGGISYFRIMTSTVSTYGSWVSTATEVGTYATAITPISPGQCFERNQQIYNFAQSTSTYTFLDKRGAAKLYILWDWLTSDMANPTNSLP